MKRLFVFLLFTWPLYGQTAIPIQNPSFEVPVNLSHTSDCGSYSTAPIPSWTSVVQPGSGGAANVIAWTCVTVPDGKQVVLLQNATISQDLGIPLKDGAWIYTLKFWVADKFYWYPGKYKASFSIGSTELCSTSGYALGDFTEYTLPCSVPYYISHYNGFGFPPGNIIISFSNTEYWPVLFDNLSLTFAPSN